MGCTRLVYVQQGVDPETAVLRDLSPYQRLFLHGLPWGAWIQTPPSCTTYYTLTMYITQHIPHVLDNGVDVPHGRTLYVA